MTTYDELYFGQTDGRREASQDPDLFVRSFVDRNDAVGKIKSGAKFLLLGPKGAGKSAVAAYLDRTQDRQKEFVRIRDLSALPLSEVERVKTGEPGGPGRTITAWKLLLLCGLLDLLLEDQASPIQSDPDVIAAANELRKLGFLDASPGPAVMQAVKTTYKLSLPGLGNLYTREKQSAFNLYHVANFLQDRITKAVATDHRYILLLDGLDSIYLTDQSYSAVTASLLQAAYELHEVLQRTESPHRIVLLLRNDIFSRLPLSDSSKMRQDLSIDLDWRVLSGNPKKSSLFQLVNRKATALLNGDEFDVISTFFHKDVQIGGRGGAPKWPNVYQYLLDLTRHTPRDLLRLLEYIRLTEIDINSDPDPKRKSSKLTNAVIREGALRYSSTYFVEAIENELVGLNMDDSLIQRAVTTLRHLRKSTFDAATFFKDFSDKTSTQEGRNLTRC